MTKRPLSDFISSIEDAEDPALELVQRMLDNARRVDPELAEAIRYCAIPRRFDAETIGVLRGAPDDPRNAELLESLRDYPFVMPREDEGFVYHDIARQQLLDDWRRDEHRAEFDDLNIRMVTFYEGLHEHARAAERASPAVGQVIWRTNRERYVQLAALLEASLLTPLLEALYHECLRSREAGYEKFVHYYEEYVGRGRVGFARSLVTAVRDILTTLPPDPSEGTDVLAWLELYRGRLALAFDRYEEAEAALRPLTEMTATDAQLSQWAMSDLADALRAQSRLTEARGVIEDAIELTETTGEDRWNWAFTHVTLGRLYSELFEPRAACRSFEAALRFAEEEGNERATALTCVELAGAHADLGQVKRAFEYALRALDLTHTSLRFGDVHGSVLAGFGYLFQDGEPRLLDTVYEEARGLSAGLTTTTGDLDARVRHLSALAASGQYRRAAALAEELEPEVEAHGNWLARVNLLGALEVIAEDTGHLRRSAELMSRPTEEGPSRAPSLKAAATHDHGRVLIQMGHLEEAERAIETARGTWEELGCTVLAARAQVHLAQRERRAGRLDEARRHLADAWPGLAEAGNWDRAEWLIERAHVAREEGNWSDADDDYRAALETERFADTRAATVRPELLEVAVRQSRWDEAAAEAATLRRVCERLEDHDSYSPSATAREADRDNANGVWRFTSDASDQFESATRAKELFESAVNKVPENGWYHLNVAYAAAALESWDDAARAMRAALRRAAWLRLPLMYERLAQWVAAHGRQLLGAGRPGEAATLLTDGAAELERALPPHRLASLNLTLGDAFHADEQPERAETTYRMALASKDPGEAGLAAMSLGSLLALRGASDEAEEAYRRVIQVGDRTNGPSAALHLGDLLAARGARAEAEGFYAEVADWDAMSAGAMGDLLWERGDEEGALVAYRHALSAPRDDPYRGSTCVRLGDLLALHEDHEAETAYRAAIDSDNAYLAGIANVRLGELLALWGDPAGAEAAFRDALGAVDEALVTWASLRLGELLLDRGDVEAGEAALREAMASQEPSVVARATLRLGDELAEHGHADALPDLVAAASGNSARAAIALGDALRERGATDLARRAFALGASRDGDLYQPDAALKLGELLEQEDRDLAAAEAAYRQAAESEDPLVAPDASLRLGDVLSGRGDAVGAKEAYERAQLMGDAEVAEHATARLAGRGSGESS